MQASNFILIAIAALAFARTAYPCGLCYEDNRAAVYSYEAVQKVKEDPERLQFVVLKVKGKLPQEVAIRLTGWLSDRRGVDPETLKISTFQKSIGFVFEKSFSIDRLLQDLKETFSGLFFELE